MIKLGEWKTNQENDCEDSNEECESVAEIQPKGAIIHEFYDKSEKSKQNYDIAVIKLAWKPRMSEFVQNIELSISDSNVKLTNQILTVTGFGKDFLKLLNDEYNLFLFLRTIHARTLHKY